MWYLRRFFFVAPFATTVQLLRYFNPNRSLVICLLSSLYYPSFLIPIPLEHCSTQKSTKYNESLRNTWVKRRLILHKTTAHFTKNNGSFYTKQRLVLHKTTAHFTQNDGSFCTKQRLVCCIVYERHNTATVEKTNSEKFYNPLSRAYAYAHITGVLSSLLSQVSHTSSHSSKFQPFTPIF